MALMARDQERHGQILLHFEQIGSVRVVELPTDGMVKEILYNAFGNMVRDEGLYSGVGRLLLPFGTGTLFHGQLKKMDEQHNTRAVHEHGFYEDGTGRNIGFFKEGTRPDTIGKDKYRIEEKQYDDKRMRRAENSVFPGKYNLLNNNCQDYADKLRNRYCQLERGDRQR